jgi:hypothetical protein
MAQIGLMTTLDLRTTAVETNNKWFIYAVAEYSHILIDFHRNGLDSDSVVNDRVEIQTGLTPVDIRPSQHILDNPLTKTLLVSFSKPTKKYWSLFSSRAARLIDRTDRLRRCDTCWDYHSVCYCHRQPVCQRCGKTGHTMDDCTAPEQCVNCLEPVKTKRVRT